MSDKRSLLEVLSPNLAKAIRRGINILLGLFGLVLLAFGYDPNDRQPALLIVGDAFLLLGIYGVLKLLKTSPARGSEDVV